MNFADILSQIKDRLKSLWGQFEESSTYQHLMDKYEDMSPRKQKLTQLGLLMVLLIILAAVPLANIFTSSDNQTEFEQKRDLTRELLRTFRDANQAPNIPQAPEPAALQTRIQSELQNLHLIPEQIKSVQQTGDTESQLVPKNFAIGAVEVHLLNLNTRQIVDVSYQLANLHPSVKLTDLTMDASQEKPGYFNYFAKIIALKAPLVAIAQAEPEPPANGKTKKRFKGGDDEGEEQAPPPPADEEK